MKQHSGIRSYLAGILTMAFVFALASPVAALTTKTIQVLTGAEIYVDGVEMNPTDANGNPVETFVYNGTTYVPLRAVSQSLGKSATWDGTNQRVYIGEAPGTKQYLEDVCPPYQTGDCYKEYDYVTMAGQKYPHGVCIGWRTDYSGWALYNLNGQYSTLTFTVGHADGDYMRDSSLSIYLDGELAFQVDLSSSDLPQTFTVSLHKALQMKISTGDYGGNYRLAQMEIH